MKNDDYDVVCFLTFVTITTLIFVVSIGYAVYKSIS
jgi:hypothetical protein